jgi:hypothetical protein
MPQKAQKKRAKKTKKAMYSHEKAQKLSTGLAG